MNRDQILEVLQGIFREFFDDDKLQLTHQSTSEDFEEWDSVAHIQIVLEIENQFDIQFEAEEVPRLTNVEAMIDSILSLRR